MSKPCYVISKQTVNRGSMVQTHGLLYTATEESPCQALCCLQHYNQQKTWRGLRNKAATASTSGKKEHFQKSTRSQLQEGMQLNLQTPAKQ